MSFTWKVFMECNKAQWFGENNSLWKSFSSLAKKLMSRIWDMSISKLMKYFKVLRHIKKTVGFFSFIALSSSPNRNLCAFTQTHIYICEEMELLSFLLCYSHLLFFLFLMSFGIRLFSSFSVISREGILFYLRVYFSNTFKYCSAVAFSPPSQASKVNLSRVACSFGGKENHIQQPTYCSVSEKLILFCCVRIRLWW